MTALRTSEEANLPRRRFLSVAAMTVAGHNLPQEAPQAFADAIVEVDGY
jgi:pimeloyl-ACP methyl ester carboxylesterase